MDQQYNHPGVVITASTGDCAYLDLKCSGGGTIEYPAASPYVLAVGGTSLSPAGNARGWAETVWSGAGSGCSLYESKPYWQTDSGCAHKTTADISAVADPNTGVAVFDRGNWTEFGGTSVASPIIAASYALTRRGSCTHARPTCGT
jgi:subtilase family serine protease